MHMPRFRTKLIIDVVVESYSREQADRRWNNTLEKIKYQSTNVSITPQLDPNWIEVTDELDSNQPSD